MKRQDSPSQDTESLGSRQEEVRRVAANFFFQYGYKGTSLKQIAKALGLRAPSLYNHIHSKQELLRDIAFEGTKTLLQEFDSAVATTDDPIEQIRRAAAAHIRHAARRRIQAHVSMHELEFLEEPAKSQLIELRVEYTAKWRRLVEHAVDEKVCETEHPGLAALGIIDLGAGVARWYQPDGKLSEDELVDFYAEQALRLCGAGPEAIKSKASP